MIEKLWTSSKHPRPARNHIKSILIAFTAHPWWGQPHAAFTITVIFTRVTHQNPSFITVPVALAKSITARVAMYQVKSTKNARRMHETTAITTGFPVMSPGLLPISTSVMIKPQRKMISFSSRLNWTSVLILAFLPSNVTLCCITLVKTPPVSARHSVYS